MAANKSLIPSLSEIPDLKPAEGGREYDLRITNAFPAESKRTGREGATIYCSFVDEENVEPLRHTLWFGNTEKYTDDDAEKSLNMWRKVKNFLRAIGLDPEQELEIVDFKGLEFTAIIDLNDGSVTDEDGNVTYPYPPKNEINRVIV